METMFASSRRSLPPVPRPTAERAAEPAAADAAPVAPDLRESSSVEIARMDLSQTEPATFEAAPVERTLARGGVTAAGPSAPPSNDRREERRVQNRAENPAGDSAADDEDPAQVFVARLRAAGPDFAAAAGAQTAVVREAVPPGRHRRSRCRVVLRYADGEEADVTFLGPVGRPGIETHAGFDASIQRWLGEGRQRGGSWLVPDDDAPDGMAVDVTAWLAAG